MRRQRNKHTCKKKATKKSYTGKNQFSPENLGHENKTLHTHHCNQHNIFVVSDLPFNGMYLRKSKNVYRFYIFLIRVKNQFFNHTYLKAVLLLCSISFCPFPWRK